jgi:hypothetical protein
MTRKELAQALREEQLRELLESSDQQLLEDVNTCPDCLGYILDPDELTDLIARAHNLSEFWQLFALARDTQDGCN